MSVKEWSEDEQIHSRQVRMCALLTTVAFAADTGKLVERINAAHCVLHELMDTLCISHFQRPEKRGTVLRPDSEVGNRLGCNQGAQPRLSTERTV